MTPSSRRRLGSRTFFWLTAAALAVAACGAMFLGRAVALRWIGSQLVHVDPLEHADVIVVLAGGTPVREIEAADLHLDHYAPRIALTVEAEPPGFAVLRARHVAVERPIDQRVRYLQELGVSRDAIVLLDNARAASTEDESRIVRDWALAGSLRKVIVVTSRFHSSRAALTFGRAFRGTGVEVLVRVASYDDFFPETWWHDRRTLRDGVFEWQKVLFYRLWYW